MVAKGACITVQPSLLQPAYVTTPPPPHLPRSLSTCRGRKCKPIFVQIARQVVKLNASDLRLPSRAWKVKLVGEGADDAGGVFDDTITEMCQVGSPPALGSGFWVLLHAPFLGHVLKPPDSGTQVVQGIAADSMLGCAQYQDCIRAQESMTT